MSTAPDLASLYSFEKYFEDAAVTFLEADCSVDVFPSASLADFVTPRIEIAFRAVEATLPVDSPISGGIEEYRKYEGEFEAVAITDQSVGGTQTRAFHLELLGKIRASLLRSSPNWNLTTLPWYGVKFIRQTGFDRQVDGDLDFSYLRWEVLFSIRSAAFPTTTTTAAP